jgi:peroxiredoxin
MKRFLIFLLLSAPLLMAAYQSEHRELPRQQFPAHIVSASGDTVDVGKLAKNKRIVVITLKATWCPVCQRQLVRIKQQLEQIEYCPITFLVLSPGPAKDLRAIKKRIGFPYPFIEDKNLTIAKKFDLVLNQERGEITPAIFILRSDLSVGWIQLGRNGSYYGDPALFDEIDCGNWL